MWKINLNGDICIEYDENYHVEPVINNGVLFAEVFLKESKERVAISPCKGIFKVKVC